MPKIPQATLRVVAEFPPHYFLENMAVRADGSMLVTVQNRKELWYVPATAPSGLVQPALLHTFEFNTTFVVEWKPELFLLGVADVYATQEARLYAIDLRQWQHGQAIQPRLMLQMPQPWAGFNGAALIAPDVLIAAGIARLLWRIDLAADGTASARVWLEHDSMKNRPGEMKPEQPGTNGVQYSARTGYLYYTTTSQQMMMRVKVDPASLDPADLPEFVAGGREWDDFLIDDDAGVAYVTTHRENTIERVRLAHDGNREGRSIAVGDPFHELLVGPSAGAWGRAAGDYGRVAYVATDGGTAQPPHDGLYRSAKILQVVLPPARADRSEIATTEQFASADAAVRARIEHRHGGAQFIVTGRLTVASSDLDAFGSELHEVAQAALDTRTCCFFAVAVENASAGRMLVVELWTEKSAQQAFLQEPVFRGFAQRWAGKMRNELRVFDALPGEQGA